MIFFFKSPFLSDARHKFRWKDYYNYSTPARQHPEPDKPYRQPTAQFPRQGCQAPTEVLSRRDPTGYKTRQRFRSPARQERKPDRPDSGVNPTDQNPRTPLRGVLHRPGFEAQGSLLDASKSIQPARIRIGQSKLSGCSNWLPEPARSLGTLDFVGVRELALRRPRGARNSRPSLLSLVAWLPPLPPTFFKLDDSVSWIGLVGWIDWSIFYLKK